MRHAYASSTARQVNKEATYFMRFCVLFGFTHLALAKDELTFMRYVAWLSATCSHDTISNYLQGTRVLYQHRGLGHPFTDMYNLAMLRRGLHRLKGGPARKKRPITPAMLLAWQQLMDSRNCMHTALLACMLVAFFGFFRKSTVAVAGSSLADPELYLRRENITVDEQLYCLAIRVPKSKTNPYRERVDTIYIAGHRGMPLDPVAAYKRMLSACPAPPDAPAFGYTQGGSYTPITHAFFVRNTKQYAAAIGVSPAEVSGHSYRRGGATCAFAAGVPDQLIQWQGIWASLCCWGLYRHPGGDPPAHLAAHAPQHSAPVIWGGPPRSRAAAPAPACGRAGVGNLSALRAPGNLSKCKQHSATGSHRAGGSQQEQQQQLRACIQP